MTEVSAPFAVLLGSQRELLNERFALRLRAGARIEPAAFFAHLRQTVDPVLQQVHRQFPERAPAVLTALFDASLDLFATSLLGPEGKMPIMLRVWTDLLPNAISLLAREPVPLVGCLCNAMYQVARQRGTRIDLWLTRMQSVLAQSASLEEVTNAGLVIAWQAGMPQFRDPALQAAARLKPTATAIALGLPEQTKSTTVQSTVESLTKDRWFRIESQSAPALAPVALAGAFSGFGGLFSRPPTVCASAGRLVVSVDDTTRWQLIADAYGTWFRRVEESTAKPTPLPRDVAVDAKGTIRWGKLQCEAPHLAKATAIACDGVTLAITVATSHHLFLFARTGGTA